MPHEYINNISDDIICTMDSLPIDTSHPAVRDYLSLVRLQVLTPLSLLINIAAVVVCTFVVDPSIAKVSHLHPTSITPNPSVVGVYVAVVFLGQIGYCLLLVVASKTETKVSYPCHTGSVIDAVVLESSHQRCWPWSCTRQYTYGTLGNRMGKNPSVFYDNAVHLVSGYARVPFRHHPPGTSPSPSPILEYCASHLPPSRQFSSTRYSPHSCSTKVLFNLAFEYSVPIVFIVSTFFLLITHLLTQ